MFPLKHDEICEVLSHLDAREALRLSVVSRDFQSASNDEGIWERYCRAKGYEEPDLLPGVETWKQMYADLPRYFVRKIPHQFVAKLRTTPGLCASCIASVAYCPTGTHLATGSWDCTVRIWNAASLECAVELSGAHHSSVTAVAFAPDGKTLASGSYDRSVRLWDLATSEPRATLAEHQEGVLALAFSPDGRLLATASMDQTVRLWDVASGACVAVLRGHTDWVRSVAFGCTGAATDHSGWLLASGSKDGTVRLWDALGGACVAVLAAPGLTQVHSVAFSPNGSLLAVGSEGKAVLLFDVARRQLRSCLAPNNGGPVAFSPDGRVLACASYDKTVRLFDTTTQRALVALSGHQQFLLSLAFSPDGRRLVTGAVMEQPHVWEACN